MEPLQRNGKAKPPETISPKTVSEELERLLPMLDRKLQQQIKHSARPHSTLLALALAMPLLQRKAVESLIKMGMKEEEIRRMCGDPTEPAKVRLFDATGRPMA